VVGRALTLEDIVDLEDEALAETGNIILNSWVATLTNLLKRGTDLDLLRQPDVDAGQDARLRRFRSGSISPSAACRAVCRQHWLS